MAAGRPARRLARQRDRLCPSRVGRPPARAGAASMGAAAGTSSHCIAPGNAPAEGPPGSPRARVACRCRSTTPRSGARPALSGKHRPRRVLVRQLPQAEALLSGPAPLERSTARGGTRTPSSWRRTPTARCLLDAAMPVLRVQRSWLPTAAVPAVRSCARAGAELMLFDSTATSRIGGPLHLGWTPLTAAGGALRLARARHQALA